jgi:hypothetical protein
MKIIDEELLTEFRTKRRCELCGRNGGCQPHHLFSKGMGGARRFDIRINLIAVCAWCHVLVHTGEIERADLLLLVAKREKTTQDAIEREIYRLRRL